MALEVTRGNTKPTGRRELRQDNRDVWINKKGEIASD